MDRLIPLGCNGFFASHGRLTMAFLLLDASGRRGILLDAGSGVGRLAEPGLRALVAGLERLDVILTHYHLDHVCGLPALPAALRRPSPELDLWAPAPPLVDAAPGLALERLVAPPLFPVGLGDLRPAPTLHAYTGAADLAAVGERSGDRLAVRRQRHGGGSVGLRLGDRLAYVTDTALDEETVDFVRGVDLLLHEVWVSGDEAREDPRLVTGHSHAAGVGALAREAGVARLLPVHHHPSRTADDLALLHRELGDDGLCVLSCDEGDVIDLAPSTAR